MTATLNPTVDSMSKLAINAKDARLTLDQIYMNTEDNVREMYEDEGMEELRNNIEAVGGILQPLLVVDVEPCEETDNKAYALVAGFRRYICLSALVKDGSPEFGENVAVRIVGLDSEGGIKVTQLIENLIRRDLNPLEKAQGIQEAMKDTETNFKASEIAKMLGMSEGSVSQHLKLLEMPESVQEMIANGEISFSHARVIMYKVPQDQWAAAANNAKGMVLSEFEAKIQARYGSGEGTETTAGEAGPTTRTPQVRRATKVINTYLPYFTKQAAEATDPATKAEWTTRVDTVKWMLQEGDTGLAKAVEPFEKELEAKEQAEKDAKDATSKKAAFTTARIKQLRELRKAVPADGMRKNTFGEDLAQVRVTVDALSKPEKKAELGFELGEVEAYMAEFSTAWTEAEKKRTEGEAARKAALEKKKAEKKAEDAKTAKAPAAAK